MEVYNISINILISSSKQTKLVTANLAHITDYGELTGHWTTFNNIGSMHIRYSKQQLVNMMK